jgi:hypothetical protein
LSVIWRNIENIKLQLHHPGSWFLALGSVVGYLLSVISYLLSVICCQLFGEILEISNYHYIILVPGSWLLVLLSVVSYLEKYWKYQITTTSSWFLALGS